ncbi:MAG: hypothetical protein ACRC2U_08560 [Aeromonas sp.]
MSSVIKVPRRYGIVAPHTVELDVKPPAPHQDSLLPQDPPGSLWLAAMCKALVWVAASRDGSARRTLH